MIDGYYAVAGAITGFFVGMTGVGGGALMTPILLLFFGVAPATAVATDLWFAVVTKLVGFGVHVRSGYVDWQVAKRLWVGSMPVAFAVVTYVTANHQIGKVAWLSHVIAWVVLVTAIGLILSPYLLSKGRAQRLNYPDIFKYAQPFLTVLAGAFLGVIVSLTSIGAGALGSVMMLYLYPLRLKPHRLVATDIVHAIPLAAIAGAGYLLEGFVDVRMLLSLLAGSIPAVLLGSMLATRAPARLVQMLLALVLVFASIRLL